MRVGWVMLAAIAGTGLTVPFDARTGAGNGTGSGLGIYTCTDANGRRLTSDRPIPECFDREQRMLNADGSHRRSLPPALTANERAQQEEAALRAEKERNAQRDAARRDRNLVKRYRSEASHNRARKTALDDVTHAIKISEDRIKQLQAERIPLLQEAEFYRDKRLPGQLKQRLDNNEASAAAQAELIQNQQAELKRVNALFDTELTHLRKLWAGAAPGSAPYPQAASQSGGAAETAATD